MKKLFSFWILLLNFTAFAQQKIPDAKNLAFNIGLKNLSFRDGVFSPLLYTGYGLETTLKYQKDGLNKNTGFGVNFGNQQLKNEFSNSASAFNIQLGYHYLRTLKTNRHWQLGGIWATKAAIRTFKVPFGGESMSGDIFSMFNIASCYQTKSHDLGQLSVLFSIPVLGIAFARKNYNLSTNPALIVVDNIPLDVLKTAELISFPQLKAISINTEYQYPVGKKINFLVNIALNLYDYKRLYTNTKSVDASLALGLNFRINSSKTKQ